MLPIGTYYYALLFVLGLNSAACDASKNTTSFPPLSTLGRLVNNFDYYTTLLTDAESLMSIDINHFPSSSLMIIGVDQATVSPNISCTWSAGSKPVLYLVAVSPQNLPSAILSLDATVTLCPERLKQGIFHGDNTIIFWMPDSSGDFSHGVQNIFSKSNYQKHVKVAAFRRVDSKRADTLLSFRYNFFSNELKAKVLQFEASKSMSSTVLRPFDMKGFVLKVGFLPFPPWCVANVNPFSNNPNQMLYDHDGSDITVLQALCKRLGCQLEFFHTSDFQWGSVQDGVTSGLYKLLEETKVDILACSQYRSPSTAEIGTPSHTILLANPMIAVSLKPQLDRSFYSLLRPFQYPIWIGIFVSLILVPVCLYVIAKLEYAAIQCSGYWTKLSRSAWYTYGTFLGEGITATLDSEPAWGMRMAVVIWLWYSFIITALYGGELRAVLLKPVSEAPLDTIRDILDSPHSWSFVDYGDGLWNYFATVFDTDGLPEFVRDSNVVEFRNFPLEYLKDVKESGNIYVEYGSVIDIAILATTQHPTGKDTAFHLAKNITSLNEDNLVDFLFYFHHISPLFDPMNSLLLWLHNCGLWHEFIQRSKVKLAKEYKKLVDEPLVVRDDNSIKMTFANYKAIFGFYFACLGFPVLVFLIEGKKLLRRPCKRTITKKL